MLMTTHKIKIKELSNPDLIEQKLYSYTGAFQFLYKTFELSEDPNHIKLIKDKYNITEIEYRSLQSYTKTRLEAFEEKQNKKLKEISDLKNSINSGKLSKKSKYKKQFKLQNKIKSLKNNVVFGTRQTLIEITKLYNKINNLDNLKEEKKVLKEELKNRLNALKTKFKEDRITNIYVLGEANQRGNRFFKFDLVNKEIIYKPSRGNTCNIKIENYKDKKVDLVKLNNMINNREISITICLSKDYINLSFDLDVYRGYRHKEREVKKNALEEVKKLKLTDKKDINKVYHKYYRELENDEVKINNKLDMRYCAIDMNPDGIGLVIFDLINDNMKFISKKYLDFSLNNRKSNKSSDHVDSKKLTNKRKNEILYSITKLFKELKGYQVYNFVMEELNINKDLENKESNRKVKNIWNRTLITNKINKEIILNNMKLIEVNPAFTSFIGNIQNNIFDPIASAIEIGRRGSKKYIKNEFYPSISDTDLDTLKSLTDKDALSSETLSWRELYYATFRWRRSLDNFKINDDYLKIRIGGRKGGSFKLIFN